MFYFLPMSYPERSVGESLMRALKVLIAEDDLVIADLTERILIDQGYEVCGIARTVAEAVALARRHEPDLAVIDLRLADGGLGTEIAAQLSGGLGTLGVLYATAHVSQLTQSAVDGQACLAKPYSPANLLRGLEIVTEIVATGTASPPFPRGFQVLPPAATALRAPPPG
jgi:CheY-like chemotaxis protein